MPVCMGLQLHAAKRDRSSDHEGFLDCPISSIGIVACYVDIADMLAVRVQNIELAEEWIISTNVR
eukprot:12922636-Prorocentrum_lima.AAC.1